jgi:cytochrome c oxidase subunit 2
MFADVPLFPEQASTHAVRVDHLYFFLLGLTAFFSILIAALIITFAIKYRRRSPDERGQPIHGGLKLEITWTVIPLLISLVIFYWGADVFFNVSYPPEDSLEVFVVGKQWMWKVQHPGGQSEINQLHVPVDRPVKVVLISQDVIHDFAVPAFRIKQDVLPGRYTATWFQATKVGTYHLFCDQYCGTNHSAMIGQVVVLSQADFQKWLRGGDRKIRGGDFSLAAKGEQLFRKLQCITCHSADARARAPVLEGLYLSEVRLQNGRTVLADDDYLRESILDPDAKIVAGFEPIMPTFQGQVDEEEIRQLIAFIRSLRRGRTPPRTERTLPPPSIKKPGGKPVGKVE